MTFNEGAQLDTSGISGGGGGGGRRGGMVVGGGIGGLILAILVALFGGGDMLGGGQAEPGLAQDTGRLEKCQTGADANEDTECLIVATLNSAEDFWAGELPRYGTQFVKPGATIYRGQTPSPCGTASNQVGPFYCPLDEGIYIDASFFQILESQFGSSGGQLAQEYVVAHEYGHHIQNIFGVLGQAQQDPRGAQSGAVRVELMADCFAGMWAQHASTTTDESGTAFLQPLTEQDVRDALSAAASVGDDRIQQKTQGQVNPEAWTHGSAEARQRWFLTGMRAESVNDCDTFAVENVT